MPGPASRRKVPKSLRYNKSGCKRACASTTGRASSLTRWQWDHEKVANNYLLLIKHLRLSFCIEGRVGLVLRAIFTIIGTLVTLRFGTSFYK